MATTSEEEQLHQNEISNIYVTNLKKKDKRGPAVLIVDPQNDFHEGGSLAVPGATADAKRIQEFLIRNVEEIENIYVTLDTHMRYHIAHPLFWVDTEGNHPKEFTTISVEDIVNGVWRTTDEDMQTWGIEYAKRLEAGKKFQLMIWPYHCLVGTYGHNVQKEIMKALHLWEMKKNRAVTFIIKGNNSKTEHYSALKAEVPVEDDNKTKLNTKLLEELQKHSKLAICGQALSHCVNFTTRDIAANWDKAEMDKLILLQDAASSVPGFEAQGEDFVADMDKMGIQIVCADKCSL